MTTSAEPQTCSVPSDRARFGVAGAIFDAMAARDFARIAPTLTADATMQALVPRGLLEFAGPDQICAAFARWFGDATDFQMLEAELGEIADRLHFQWRLRVRAQSRGAGWQLVEQHLFAEPDEAGRIARLRLLCSGFRPEPVS